MLSFEELFKQSSTIHGHRCAGQVLGVRMAMLGCRESGIDDPRGCKKLVVYVEIDRCATDAIQAVTGCSLGKRTLKFLDYGKMAATFVNTETGQAVRVLAKDNAREWVPKYAPGVSDLRQAQKEAYRIMPEELLFTVRPVAFEIPAENFPGFRSPRVDCQRCGEGINLRREVRIADQTLCVPCALIHRRDDAMGNILLIVGSKKVGKTTLIENLVQELSGRGYHVATVKHHHSQVTFSTDLAGSDSWRHRQAGATGTILVSPDQIAVFRDGNDLVSLERVLPLLGPYDLVLVEGFHDQPHAKIEVVSQSRGRRLCSSDEHLLATVGGIPPVESTVPYFDAGNTTLLADFVVQKLLSNLCRTQGDGESPAYKSTTVRGPVSVLV